MEYDEKTPCGNTCKVRCRLRHKENPAAFAAGFLLLFSALNLLLEDNVVGAAFNY